MSCGGDTIVLSDEENSVGKLIYTQYHLKMYARNQRKSKLIIIANSPPLC